MRTRGKALIVDDAIATSVAIADLSNDVTYETMFEAVQAATKRSHRTDVMMITRQLVGESTHATLHRSMFLATRAATNIK
jgi:hypothetical protein